jgi:phage shock protein C
LSAYDPNDTHEDRTGWIILGVVLIIGGVGIAASNMGLIPWPLAQIWRTAWQARVGLGVLALGVLLVMWSQSASRPKAPARGTRLYRSRSDKMVAGVLGGLAQHFSVDATLMRLAFVALVILLDVGGLVVAYIVMAIVVPMEPEARSAEAPQPQWPTTGDGPPPAPPM